MNAYEEIKTLGRGAFAVVMLVRRKTDKEKFVIKRLFTPMSELTPKVCRACILVCTSLMLPCHRQFPNTVDAWCCLQAFVLRLGGRGGGGVRAELRDLETPVYVPWLAPHRNGPRWPKR